MEKFAPHVHQTFGSWLPISNIVLGTKATLTTFLHCRPWILLIIFLLHVIMDLGMALEVKWVQFTSYSVLMTTSNVVLETNGGSMWWIVWLCLQYGLCKKGLISFKARLQWWKKLDFSFSSSQNVLLIIFLVMKNIP
jgi:hypothetical protein